MNATNYHIINFEQKFKKGFKLSNQAKVDDKKSKNILKLIKIKITFSFQSAGSSSYHSLLQTIKFKLKVTLCRASKTLVSVHV